MSSGCTFDKILGSDTPNQGRKKINDNFDKICNLSFSGGSGFTQVISTDTNVNVVDTSTTSQPLYEISLSENISASTISASTYYVGNTPLSSLTGNIVYSNTSPTPTTIGGISAGSTFSAQTMQQMWDALLYPYQTPSFTSFSRTSINSIYELGQSAPGGSQTFSWSTSNSSNVSPNTISIVENHSTTTLLTNSANDGSETLLTSSFSRTTPGSTTLYTITANNTQSGSLSSVISRNWRGRWYYGTNSNTSITTSIITGGTFTTTLTNGVVNSYVTLTPSGAEYVYLVIPNYLPQPSDLRDSVAGCFGNNHPYLTQGTITFDNDYGVSQTYNIYRTTNAFNSSVNVWLCS
jgi:hypothetical protein